MTTVAVHRAPGSPGASTAPAVAATDVTRRFGEGATAVDALQGVSLEVAAGELIGIMGPSGSGKSTLLHILAGSDRPTTGEVRIGADVLAQLADRELTRLRRDRVGFVFQFFNLLPMLTAEGNIVLPLKLAGRHWDRTWVDELIDQVGLGDRRHHRPSELSGGQQQRVAIARALVMRPTVVFADEPTGNLDSHSGAEILELLRSSAQALGQTIVVVTHEPKVSEIVDRILLLADGRIVDELHHESSQTVMQAIERAGSS